MLNALSPEWQQFLQAEFQKEYFQELTQFVHNEYATHICYPPQSQIFRAFELCPLQETKVVILGQDPYHNPGQAEGLAFSVPNGIAPPPSLVNIFKEIRRSGDQGIRRLGDQDGILHVCKSRRSGDQGIRRPGDQEGWLPLFSSNEPEVPLTHFAQPDTSLVRWAQQGVLLLNTTLTVRQGQAGSHQRHGWEIFTDAVISLLAQHRQHLVFMLWGNPARRKQSLVDAGQHLILQAAHPSPLSANRGGWFGNNHFALCNQYLVQHHLTPIHW